MSRRQSKHLERDRVVAEQIADALDSRGPCPGECNAAWRRLRARWEREVMAVADELQVEHPDATPAYRLQLASQRVREAWVKADRAARPAREGAPVWCHRCTAEIRRALDRLPRMLLLTIELGMTAPKRPDGSLVTDPVRVLSTSEQDDDGRVVDSLGCGHRRTRRAFIGPVSEVAMCRTCLASASVPEPGRLAPAERAGRRGPRQPVSPAGSPAWLEADAAVEWACSSAAVARFLLGALSREGYDAMVEAPPWRRASSQQRIRMAVDGARFLLRRLDEVLALPGPTPLTVGVEARAVSARLEQVSGMAVKEHALADDCPACARRGLVREDGGSLVHCRSCLRWWDEETYEAELAAKLERVGA